jgi:hypothetical protein
MKITSTTARPDYLLVVEYTGPDELNQVATGLPEEGVEIPDETTGTVRIDYTTNGHQTQQVVIEL